MVGYVERKFSQIGLFQLLREKMFMNQQENLVINPFSKYIKDKILMNGN